MSTAPTDTPLEGSTPLSDSTAAKIIVDQDLEFYYQFLTNIVKGQLEMYLPLYDNEALRKIRHAANDCEGMSLLKRALEEDSTLQQKLREATRKVGLKGI